MKIIKVWNDNPSDRQLQEIVNELEMGSIMIYPTDTLYAIGCDALNVKAIDRICKLKGINPDKTNLSIICSDLSQVSEYARYDNQSFRLLKDNTPGPFTFLLKSTSSLPKAFKGRKIVGVRIPDCATIRAIVDLLGDVAKDHRNGELQDLFPGGTLGHIRSSKHTLDAQNKTTPYIFLPVYSNVNKFKMQPPGNSLFPQIL